MPIINTLREKMGRLVVIVVGFSIVAFVLTDVLSNNSSLFGGGNNPDIGEISGEAITFQQFNNMVENEKVNFQQRYGIPANELMTQQIRSQVWEQMINNIAYGQRFEDASIVIGDAEMFDMVQGENVSPQISQNPEFWNPQTGAYDPAYIQQILNSLNQSQQGQLQWLMIQSQLNATRQQQKYENLFLKTNYVTLAEAIQEYQSTVAKVNIDYLYVPYGLVSDSAVSVTDSELQAYLNENSEQYQVEESRSIDYVSFPIVPNADDSAQFRAEMDDIKRALEESTSAEQDSLIVDDATDQGGGFRTYAPGALPIDIKDNLETLAVGDIVGPRLTDGIFTLSKLSGIKEGENEFVRVSHILLKTQGLDLTAKSRVRTKAQGLLRQLRNGADFAELARKNSEDGSGPAGGLMPWYQKNVGDERGQKWVKPFEDAAFSTKRKGLINRLIESEFGYHIMYINSPASKNMYQVGTVLVEMTPSLAAQNTTFQQVGEFLQNADDLSSFNSFAEEKGLSVFSGNNIGASFSSIGRLQGSNVRQIVNWLYRDASMEDVKEFELEDEYVVAVYRDKVEEGTAELEDVRLQIEPLVRNEKKLAYVKEKLEGLSGSLSEMATAYGPEARFYNAPSLTFNTPSLPNVGGGDLAIGAAFGLTNPGERTGAIDAGQGVVIIELKEKVAAADIADYTSYMTQIQQKKQTNDRTNLRQSIREAADIVDERYKYY